MTNAQLYTTKQAAAYIRVSEDVYRRIAKELQIKPDGFYIAYKKYCPKWSENTVETIASSDLMQEALKRKNERRSQLPPDIREMEEKVEELERQIILHEIGKGRTHR